MDYGRYPEKKAAGTASILMIEGCAFVVEKAAAARGSAPTAPALEPVDLQHANQRRDELVKQREKISAEIKAIDMLVEDATKAKGE